MITSLPTFLGRTGPDDKTMPPSYRTTIAAYLSAGHHLQASRAKSVRQIARELSMSASTVRRWLQLNHRDLWLKYWFAGDALPSNRVPPQRHPSAQETKSR